MKSRLWIHAVALWLLAPALLWLAVDRPHGGDTHRAARLPERLGRFAIEVDRPITAELAETFGTGDAVWRRHSAADGFVDVVVVYHDANWKSVHAPDTCLRGSNMTLVEDGPFETTIDGAARSVGRLRLESFEFAEDYLSLYAYVAPPDFVSGSYADFVWHHAPRALLRASLSGCLVRAETWIDDGDIAAAEARCAEVLVAAVEHARGLLR